MDSRNLSRKIAALLPSLTDVMFLMPLFLLMVRFDGVSELLEGDTGWHLRTGEWILANGQVPYTDMFSYTKPGQPWFAWEWLWDLVFGWFHREYGLASVILGNMAVICLTSALLFRLVLRTCGYRFLSALFTFIAMAVTSLHWFARPHVFTWLFVVMSLWVLEWKRSGERNLLWTLPLLTVLWVNVHGGFFVVLLLLVSYAAGEIVSGAIEPDSERRWGYFRNAVPYAVSMVWCLAASVVNPYTYHLHQHIVKYVADSESPFFRHIAEWQSISFHSPVAKFVEVLLLVSLVACFWQAARRRFVYVFLTLGWLHLGLTSGRNWPIFALVAAPMAAQAVVEVAGQLRASGIASWIKRTLDALRSVDLDFGETDALPRIYLTSAVGIALLGLLMFTPQAPARFHSEYSDKRYPAKVIASLSRSALAGNVFADDEWGDYLIYRLYPSTKVFIDGRFDFYGSDHTTDYLNILNGKHDWEKRLGKFGIDTILLSVDSTLVSTLKESGRWVPVYDDGIAILFYSRARLARTGPPTKSEAPMSAAREVTALRVGVVPAPEAAAH